MATTHSSDAAKRAWGLVVRREVWLPSWRGWLLGALLLAGLVLTGLLTVHRFLAVNQPVESRHLVVEGWVRDYAIREAVKVFESGHYEMVIATGGPVFGSGSYTTDFNTSAHVGASRLRAAGLGADLVHKVPARFVGRDRTFTSAVALRNWLKDKGLDVRSLNVVTESVHARRTRLLFQEALGPEVNVGIISAKNPDYDELRWWRSSHGTRDVIGETIAFLYARFVFSTQAAEGQIEEAENANAPTGSASHSRLEAQSASQPSGGQASSDKP